MFADAPFGVVRLDGEGVESAVMMDANRALVEMTRRAGAAGRALRRPVRRRPGHRRSLPSSCRRRSTSRDQVQACGAKAQKSGRRVHHPRPARQVRTTAYVIDMSERKQLEQRRACRPRSCRRSASSPGGLAHDFNNLLAGHHPQRQQAAGPPPAGRPHLLRAEVDQRVRLAPGPSWCARILAFARQARCSVQEVLDVTDALSDYYTSCCATSSTSASSSTSCTGATCAKVKVRQGAARDRDHQPLHNARDAMIEKSGGGRLVIRTSRSDAAAARKDGFTHVTDGDYVLIEVVDDGGGIPPEIMEKILRAVLHHQGRRQGHGSRPRTVLRHREQLGGFIYPVSKVGRGTTFRSSCPPGTASRSSPPLAACLKRRSLHPRRPVHQGRPCRPRLDPPRRGPKTACAALRPSCLPRSAIR